MTDFVMPFFGILHKSELKSSIDIFLRNML